MLGAASATISASASADSLPESRRPGFAAVLAESGPLDLVERKPSAAIKDSFLAVGLGSPADRQQLRWEHALNLLAHQRGSDAAAVLQVMLDDDPDLALVGQFQLVRGAALSLMGRGEDALAALAEPSLTRDPAACLWRIRAAMAAELPSEALRNKSCARPSLDALPGDVARPFTLELARAELSAGDARAAHNLLQRLAEDDASANLLRGKGRAAAGDVQEARLLFGRVLLSGSPSERADAALSDIELTIADGGSLSSEQQKNLGSLLLSWRGGPIERRALRVEMILAGNDDRRALSAGATLFRYHRLGPETRDLADELSRRLSARLHSRTGEPLEDLGALFWEYRDLLPGSSEGDRLVTALARRFQAAGLYARGAQLLDYRLNARAKDLAKGPLSVEVASLYILAGQPENALEALRASADVRYPNQMRWSRQKVEAVALFHLHRTAEALAVLQDVPGAQSLSADMLWEGEDWGAFVKANDDLIASSPSDEVTKVAVLRHAIALAMLGEGEVLARLRREFGRTFHGDPLQPAFNLLTSETAPSDGNAFAAAMAALPRTVEPSNFTRLLAAREPSAAAEPL